MSDQESEIAQIVADMIRRADSAIKARVMMAITMAGLDYKVSGPKIQMISAAAWDAVTEGWQLALDELAREEEGQSDQTRES